jgi:hypothetical protein
MPLRSCAFSDLRFSPPERHPGTIWGNKDRHSRSANECICVSGLHVGHKRTHHVPPHLQLLSRLVDTIEEYHLFSSMFGESNLRPERIRNPVKNIFVLQS